MIAAGVGCRESSSGLTGSAISPQYTASRAAGGGRPVSRGAGSRYVVFW